MIMKKFIVEITETLQRRIVVEADNINDARQQTKARYMNSDIVLDNDNFTGVSVNVLEERTIQKCPRCGKDLSPSVLNNYLWYCKECDENFYDEEVTD